MALPGSGRNRQRFCARSRQGTPGFGAANAASYDPAIAAEIFELRHFKRLSLVRRSCGADRAERELGVELAPVLLPGSGDVVPVRFDAEPYSLQVDFARTAFVIIDMLRDFLEPGGFGAALGNDVSLLAAAIEPIRLVLQAARQTGILVIHTREGHRPDLSDAPPLKVERGDPTTRIGAPGPMGRILIRGEAGHDIIPQLYPVDGEPVIDKPGKGAFYQTDLDLMLRNRGIDTLMVAGVTTEVCVNTTIREANDRGYRCIALSDGCASYFPHFHEVGLAMIKAQGGIFGWVSDSAKAVSAIRAYAQRPAKSPFGIIEGGVR